MSSAPSMSFRRIVAGGVALGAAWWFHTHWIAPLRQRETECQQAVADVQQHLSDAKAELKEIGREEQEVAHARGLLDSLHADVPKGPTVVWLPVRLRTHLRSAGIAEAGIRINSVVPESGVAGYERTYWHLNLSKQEGMQNMSAVLLAVAEIERQAPFVRILDVSFCADNKEPHWPVGGFNVTALVPKN